MKILSRALLLLFVLLGVLIAVSNSQSVQLALWPLPHIIIMPVYLLVVLLLLFGVLAGLGIGWWAGRHHRRHAREAVAEASRLEREIQRVRQAVAAAAPSPSPSARPTAPHEQRAIERQSALVAPDHLASPNRSGPFS